MLNRRLWLPGIGLGLWLGLGLLAQLVAESLWFEELGYSLVFWRRLQTQVGIGAIASTIGAIFLLGNLGLAKRLEKNPQDDRPVALSFRWLLPLAFGLSLLAALLLLHYGQAVWQIGFHPINGTPPLPARFRPESLWQLVQQLVAGATPPYLSLGVTIAGAIALLIYRRVLLIGLAIGLALGSGWVLSAHWGTLLQAIYATAFDRSDPLFQRDIRFYIFVLPLWELLEFWLVGLFLFALVAVALWYLLAGNSLSQGHFLSFSRPQQRHLCGLGGGFMLVVAFSYWLSRYEILYSTRGVTYGASYTDVTVQLPVSTTFSVLAGTIGLTLLWQAIGKQKMRLNWLWVACGLFLVGALLAGELLPIAVQQLVVQPNELAREQPYMQRSIALTRSGFALDSIEVETFNPQNSLTDQTLQQNDLTIRNIRLWDTRPLLETNRQLQQIRPYYQFFDADIDRYTLLNEETAALSTEKQQVLIAARELNYSTVPKEARTWVNEHLTYTHGYGFTLSPVNKVAPGGLPDYFVRDIGTGSSDDTGGLATSSERIRASIPIAHPRIYYGEITNTYVMTGTQVKELDYPSGNDNVYNTYDGTGGIAIAPLWRRWLFARYLNDWQMVLTENFTPQTKLLFRRNISDRIRAVAPFLRFDQDPYLVVADAGVTGQTASRSPSYLYWIVDAYTTSDRYPYSEPEQIAAQASAPDRFNYIRNSVKVVIDAYNGSVDFYAADPSDPILRTWMMVFPGLVKPLNQLPEALRSHLRYPADLFSVQSKRLMTYHMTDPQVFYNREDQWQIPNEIYGTTPQPVQPYYLILKLPTAQTEEFILLLPFTPNQRTNLIAWLAARSDGTSYGKSLLYTFSKQQLVYGTEQIEARINQDPVISQQISLWNRQGSRALQGNLLVIPIAQSLLYVEPLYLEAEQNSLPTLVRVIVAYENRIVMAETLEQGLQAIFEPQKPASPAIVRPVE